MNAPLPFHQAMPAPIWFVQFFKALGFTLHAVPMNLWYAGLLIALWLHLRGSDEGRRFAGRLLRQMPVIVAVGVNLGIVPLLFVQTAYYTAFYSATILMAWFWLAIIGLLIPAYYGVYAYAWGIHNGSLKKGATAGLSSSASSTSRENTAGQASSGTRILAIELLQRTDNGPDGVARWRKLAGWCSAVFFVVIGFLFSNGLSLMDHCGRWADLWTAHGHAGTAYGTALNLGDPTLWPRWLLMFGLAIGTVAAWVVVDAEWLTRNTTGAAYRRWAWRFARGLYTVGMVWAAAAGAWYVFGTWSDDLRKAMFAWPLAALTVATAVATGLPWLLLLGADRFVGKRLAAAAIAAAQIGVLGVNAASRQIVQNLNLKPCFDVLAQPTDVQWGPLAMFLIVFVLALAVLGWMLVQVARCQPGRPSPGGKK